NDEFWNEFRPANATHGPMTGGRDISVSPTQPETRTTAQVYQEAHAEFWREYGAGNNPPPTQNIYSMKVQWYADRGISVQGSDPMPWLNAPATMINGNSQLSMRAPTDE